MTDTIFSGTSSDNAGVPPLVGTKRYIDAEPANSSAAVLAHAAGSIAAVEEEIADLWSAAIEAGNKLTSERLVYVSHALMLAARALDQQPLIGLAPTTLASPTDPRLAGVKKSWPAA